EQLDFRRECFCESRHTTTRHQTELGTNEPRRPTHRTEKRAPAEDAPQSCGQNGSVYSPRSHHSALASSTHSRYQRVQAGSALAPRGAAGEAEVYTALGPARAHQLKQQAVIEEMVRP